MTSEGLGEMLEGDSADMCTRKFPLMPMGGRAEGLVCADPGARTGLDEILEGESSKLTHSLSNNMQNQFWAAQYAVFVISNQKKVANY